MELAQSYTWLPQLTSCSLILCNRVPNVTKSKLPCMVLRAYSNSIASKLQHISARQDARRDPSQNTAGLGCLVQA
jgi:hypothetical protein